MSATTLTFVCVLIAAVAISFAWLYRRGNPPAAGRARWIEVQELHDGFDDRSAVAIIDVRGPDEFAGPLGHLPGALNLPLAELPQRLSELAEYKHAPIVIVCRTDKRSASAAALLVDAGFADVSILRGGMQAWASDGRPAAPESI